VIFFWRKRFGMQTMRVPVGRVPQIKHTCEGRKIPFIKNACNNFDEKKLNESKKTETKFNEVQEINDKMIATIFKITENGYITDKMTG
jgi:hypothetical protein